MFSFMIQKLLHKKWMNLCLFAGFFLLISIAMCNPMYQSSALERLLHNEFALEQKDTGIYQGNIMLTYLQEGDKTETGGLVFKDGSKAEEQLKKLFPQQTLHEVEIQGLSIVSTKSTIQVGGNLVKRKLKMTTMTELADHIEIIDGELYKNEVSTDGIVDVIVSRGAMIKQDYVLGEIINCDSLTWNNGKRAAIRICGVFDEKAGSQYYWGKSANGYTDEVFISEECREALIEGSYLGNQPITYTYLRVLDLNSIHKEQVEPLLRSIKKVKVEDGEKSKVTCTVAMNHVLNKYQENKDRIVTTMIILQVPIIILLLAFIYMVSRQMLDMEKAEIAMLKSRGASKMQIVRTYLGQSLVIAFVAFVLGLPGGYLLCKLLGSSDAFMQFGHNNNNTVVMSTAVLVYGIIAVLIGVLCTTVPVFRHAKIGIVEQKQQTGNNEPPIWRKFWLDVILFLFGVYEFYSFSNQKEVLMKKMEDSQGLDPMLYMSASIFMLGAGLVALRLLPLLVKLIYRIRKKRWGCAMYSSFLQIIRTSNRQLFISTFLILTVATGIFCATTARSLNQNQKDRLRYDNGADIIIKEQWRSNIATLIRNSEKGPVLYEESDYTKYTMLDQVEDAARVIRDDNATILKDGQESPATFCGINTKEFGETAWMKDGRLDKHWYHYLNAMAKQKNGILISSDAKKGLKLKVGDSIRIQRKNERDGELGAMGGVICGFIEAFPGYVKGDGNYFIVANYGDVLESFGLTPYEVWMKIKSDDTSFIYDYMKQESIRPTKFEDTKEGLRRLVEEPINQVTNGLLTLNFIVILILCMMGFLLYWILSIKQRQLLFGIYRAMGMSMKEVSRMLVNEHIFSSVMAIGVGVGVGILSSVMYIPLILLTYLPKKHNLPIQITTQLSDMIRLGVCIGFMLFICFIVIRTILKKMKITQVLKLGEE